MQLDTIAFIVLLPLGCAELGVLNLVAAPALLRERERARGELVEPDVNGSERSSAVDPSPPTRGPASTSLPATRGAAPQPVRVATDTASARAGLSGAGASANVPEAPQSASAATGSKLPPSARLVPGVEARPAASSGTVPSPSAGRAGSADPVARVSNEPLLRIGFKNSSPMYTPAGRLAIFALARRMKLEPALRVRLVGHTDDRGLSEENMRLSLRRAEVVATFLGVLGVEAGRVTVEGQGGRDPLDAEQTPEAQARNRRVEAFVEGGTE